MTEGARSRILIVDDELALLRVLEQYMRRIGYEVVACSSALAALEQFRADPRSFTLVVADVTLPDIGGIELLRRMIELNPALTALVCSGYPFDVETLPPEWASQVAFVQKPFSPRMLAEAVGRLMQPPGRGPQDSPDSNPT